MLIVAGVAAVYGCIGHIEHKIDLLLEVHGIDLNPPPLKDKW